MKIKKFLSNYFAERKYISKLAYFSVPSYVYFALLFKGAETADRLGYDALVYILLALFILSPFNIYAWTVFRKSQESYDNNIVLTYFFKANFLYDIFGHGTFWRWYEWNESHDKKIGSRWAYDRTRNEIYYKEGETNLMANILAGFFAINFRILFFGFIRFILLPFHVLAILFAPFYFKKLSK